MGEPKDYEEFLNNPEARSAIFNAFLKQAEDVTVGKRTVALIEGLTFDDLTPQLWARINSGMDALKTTIAVSEASVKMSGAFLDDPEAMSVISKHVELREENGGQ